MENYKYDDAWVTYDVKMIANHGVVDYEEMAIVNYLMDAYNENLPPPENVP